MSDIKNCVIMMLCLIVIGLTIQLMLKTHELDRCDRDRIVSTFNATSCAAALDNQSRALLAVKVNTDNITQTYDTIRLNTAQTTARVKERLRDNASCENQLVVISDVIADILK